MKQYLLGIDNGGTYSKAALFDLEGNQICKKSIQIPVHTPKEGFTQRSLDDIRQANYQIVADVVKECDGEILAVGISGHGKGLYLLDKDHRDLYEGIGSTDGRALSYELSWKADGTADRIYEKTAQQIMACQPVALLRWLKDHERKVYDEIGAILSMKDFVRFCLTGEVYAEYTDISGTNLLNLYTKEYDRELLEEFGIEEIYECLPPVRKSYEEAGCVSKAAAGKTGLKEGTPVAGGIFDIDSCALAMGNVNPMDLCVIAGTWGINEYVSPKIIDDHSIAMNSIFCNPEYILAEESSAASAGNLEWVMKLLKESDYDLLNQMVSDIPPEDSNVYYTPFLYASNENPMARGMLVGLSSYHNTGHIIRAVYEGVVFAHRKHIDALMKNRKKPEYLRLAGGVVNSPVWSQMFADILNIPVRLIPNVELGAKGAAIAAGVCAGVYKDYDDAARRCVKLGGLLTPNPEMTAIYDKKYANYRRIVEAMDNVWEYLV